MTPLSPNVPNYIYPVDTAVGDRRTMKLSPLMDNPSHLMQDTLAALYSSFTHRGKQPECLLPVYPNTLCNNSCSLFIYCMILQLLCILYFFYNCSLLLITFL